MSVSYTHLDVYKRQAFTLIEMLVVLLIISVLLLLFVPNLTKQKDSVKETGNAAVVKAVSYTHLDVYKRQIRTRFFCS